MSTEESIVHKCDTHLFTRGLLDLGLRYNPFPCSQCIKGPRNRDAPVYFSYQEIRDYEVVTVGATFLVRVEDGGSSPPYSLLTFRHVHHLRVPHLAGFIPLI